MVAVDYGQKEIWFNDFLKKNKVVKYKINIHVPGVLRTVQQDNFKLNFYTFIEV